MDNNKLNKLRDIGYTVRKCCGRCVHADLSTNGWGTCMNNTYEHKKHEGGDKGSERQLSINQYGYCKEFELCEFSDLETWHYKELYE